MTKKEEKYSKTQKKKKKKKQQCNNDIQLIENTEDSKKFVCKNTDVTTKSKKSYWSDTQRRRKATKRQLQESL